MDIMRFRKLPVLGILRGVGEDAIPPLVEAMLAAGLETLEIAMNSKDAAAAIRRAKESAGSRLTVGAGTVLDPELLKIALDAGASFIVTPVLVPEVAEYCSKNIIPFFPGALTPQEIYNAWHAGATMVKVFPAGALGPGYLREVKGPFNNVELLACGGVTADNVRSYFDNGANAVAFGASIFRKEWIEKRDFRSIKESIKKLLEQVTNCPRCRSDAG